jgi:hypothetical protein
MNARNTCVNFLMASSKTKLCSLAASAITSGQQEPGMSYFAYWERERELIIVRIRFRRPNIIATLAPDRCSLAGLDVQVPTVRNWLPLRIRTM